MKAAARAIILKDNLILVMQRNKRGSQYYTFVGGQTKPGEDIEQALVREVMEETGLKVTSRRLVFVEKHPEPYIAQYTYLCEVESLDEVSIQPGAEEEWMNIHDTNSHTPMWVETEKFSRLPFLTAELQKATVEALQNGFSEEPLRVR